MGESLSTPAAEPPGQFQHKLSGSTVRVFWKSGIMHQEIQERGLSADYPVAYAVGAGSVGKSYLIDLGGHLFQSPAAFYTRISEWDASPGYETSRVLDFSRAITSDCLVCHAGHLQQESGKVELTAISCDRCHGPVENHLRNPVPGSIVNPAKLAVRERDSVCEQCHLEGAAVVLNPGKDWWDFHPGEKLETVETHYVYRTADNQSLSIAAVSQAEQLSLSACLRGSGGKLWCGTCHNPHGEPVARKQQMKGICESCHSTAQLAATHKPDQQDCVSCHMPSRKAVDISHAAVTDHRIARRPATVANDENDKKVMVAWHDALPAYSQRDLGLAFFNTARRQQSVADFQQSLTLLSKLPSAQQDGAVSAARGYMLLGSGQTKAAVECFRHSVEDNPQSAEYWLDLGVAEEAAGDAAGATKAFQTSIEKNPYDYRPYEALGKLCKTENKPEMSQSVLRDFLRVVPQSITIRLSQ